MWSKYSFYSSLLGIFIYKNGHPSSYVGATQTRVGIAMMLGRSLERRPQTAWARGGWAGATVFRGASGVGHGSPPEPVSLEAFASRRTALQHGGGVRASREQVSGVCLPGVKRRPVPFLAGEASGGF